MGSEGRQHSTFVPHRPRTCHRWREELTPFAGGMLETAENLRREFQISREEQDYLAARSHARPSQHSRKGALRMRSCPSRSKAARATSNSSVDEHPRADTTVETLAALKPVMLNADPEATVTAGNASGQNDAAAACIVTTREKAEALGLKPLGRLVAWAAAGVEPGRMGIGPVPSTERALDRAGLKLSNIDLIELNEAFAAQVLACTKSWGFSRDDFDRFNVNGSGISLGHPGGRYRRAHPCHCAA